MGRRSPVPRTGSRTASTRTAGGTRERLVDAAVVVLAEHGYAGATSRAIAQEAGCNQALVFYHHGTLNDLLLAALDVSNQTALDRYRGGVEQSDGIGDLLGALRELYRQDRASGHIGLLAQLVAGGIVDPELGAEVAERVEPWIELTRRALMRVLPGPVAGRLPVDDLAYVIVTAALGGELLASLTGDHARNRAVLDRLSGGGIFGLFGRQR